MRSKSERLEEAITDFMVAIHDFRSSLPRSARNVRLDQLEAIFNRVTLLVYESDEPIKSALDPLIDEIMERIAKKLTEDNHGR